MMPSELHKIRRRREIRAGLTIILAAFSYITALLLDFNFVSPYTTLHEDLSYLSTHLQNQQISIWAWLAASLITFMAIPPFILLLYKMLRVLHYLNAVLLLGASVGFFLMGIAGLELYQELASGSLGGLDEANEQEWLKLLSLYQDELFYRRVGIELDQVDKSTDKKYGLKEGVFVKVVRPESNAAKYGLKPGDLLIKINITPIEDMDSFNKAISQSHHLPSITLIVQRGPIGYSLTLPF